MSAARVRLNEIVKQMGGLPSADPEVAHAAADTLLLEALALAGAPDVAAAYRRLVARCEWWAAA